MLDDASPTAVSGARVAVWLFSELSIGISVSNHPEEAITDANGRFAFAGLPAGLYQLVIEAPGYAWPPDGSEVRRFQVVAGRMITGLIITIKKAARVGGRLFTGNGDPAARTPVKALKLLAERATEVGGAQTNDRGVLTATDLGPYEPGACAYDAASSTVC